MKYLQETYDNISRRPMKYLQDTNQISLGQQSNISRTPINISMTPIKYLRTPIKYLQDTYQISP